MNDYMRALYHRFDFSNVRMERLRRMIDETHDRLTEQLDKPERKLLLKLIDLEDVFRDQACLNSFMSGFRLAQGIQQELLADQPPYDFAAEDEQRAFESSRKEIRKAEDNMKEERK